MQIACGSQHDCADTNTDTRFVHHVEHLRQALMWRTDQITDTAFPLAKFQKGIHDTSLPQLVIHAGKLHIVALAQTAIGIDQKFRHDKQTDALHTGRATGNLCQHHVHDIFRQIMFAAGDPHFRATDAIGTIVMQCRSGFDIAER